MTKAYVFDAYGTLFDVHSATARHRDEVGPNADRLSQIWRAKHLEYTWIYGAIGRRKTFWELASASLAFAAESVGGIDDGVKTKLLSAYRTLDAYPEVPGVLAELKRRGAATAILSNGDPDMLADAVASAGIGAHIDHVLSVAAAGTFKPAATVYDLVGAAMPGIARGDVSFQSSNRWDAAAATAYGFEVAWINRTGAPSEYTDLPATRVLGDLNGLVAT